MHLVGVHYAFVAVNLERKDVLGRADLMSAMSLFPFVRKGGD